MLISDVNMKRFVIRLIVFIITMFIIDRCFGLAMDYLKNHAKGGYVGHHNYILNQTNEDVLVFGSSRAIHHYNPQIVADSLGMKCYNCGQDGNGIVLFYGWWQIIKDRHLPKMIIYDVNPDFDLLKGDNNQKYLGWLKSEYCNEGVKQVFEDVDSTEKYKMLSMMYRYNSIFLQIITDSFHPLFNITANGYLPLLGKMNKMKIKKKANDENEVVYDAQKLTYIEEFVEEVKNRGIVLVFVASPIWYGMSEAVFNPLQDLCVKYQIPFYNFSNDENYVHNDLMFTDGNHLNAYGADKFTSKICSKIRNIE